MQLKHLQFNTCVLKNPEKVAKFIIENKFDTATLNEISYPIAGKNRLKELLEKAGYYYCEGVDFYHEGKKIFFAEAICSKFPIIDFSCNYYNGSDFSPKHLKDEDLLGNVVNDKPEDHFEGSRGLKHSIKSRVILTATVQIGKKFLKLMTVQFFVSDLCTEIVQAYDLSKLIKSLISNSKDIPTIFSGDLNIRAKSYSVANLKKVITCHTEKLTDTLSKDHKAKFEDFPKGLAVDHVFSKRLKHIKTETVEVDFSDHKAVVSEFEL